MTHKLLIEFVHCEFNAGTNQTKPTKKWDVYYIKSYIKFCREQEEKKSTHERLFSNQHMDLLGEKHAQVYKYVVCCVFFG